MVKLVSQIRKLVLPLALTDLLWLGWFLAHIGFPDGTKEPVIWRSAQCSSPGSLEDACRGQEYSLCYMEFLQLHGITEGKN